MPFYKYLIILIFILSFSCSTNNNKTKRDLSGTNFIYLDGKSFKLKGKDFFPVMVNYAVCFRMIHNKCCLSFIKDYNNDNKFVGNTSDSLELQIRGHMQLIKDMGFNSIRLILNRVSNDKSKYFYYADDKKLYLDKDNTALLNALEKFINIVSDYDIRVMLLIKEPLDNNQIEDFTTGLLSRFKDNPSIFSYDFYNEPLYFDKDQLPINTKFRDKENAYHITYEWKKLMTKYAPNQMFTIGFAEPIDVFEWDPDLLPVDFVEVHTYNPLRVPNELYWYGKYINKPWMVGETALPADGDSIKYDEQRLFMKEVYRRIVNCGGCGIGWWQFHDTPYGNFEAKYTGILNCKGYTKTKDGKYLIQGSVKPAAQEIPNFKDYKSKSSCPRMANFFNMLGYNNFEIKGKILNEINGKPIEGAVIRGWNAGWSVGMNTFTDENGEFTLYSNDKCIHFEISAPKMSVIKFNYNAYYIPVSGKYKNMKIIPNQFLEYQQISYKQFLNTETSSDTTNCDFLLFNFVSNKFNQSKFIGTMEVQKLKPLNL